MGFSAAVQIIHKPEALIFGVHLPGLTIQNEYVVLR
jgi:hypothetical protein